MSHIERIVSNVKMLRVCKSRGHIFQSYLVAFYDIINPCIYAWLLKPYNRSSVHIRCRKTVLFVVVVCLKVLADCVCVCM